MATAISRSCPKCRGYLMLERDNYGVYEQCLQCGYIHDLQIIGGVDKQQDEAPDAEQGIERASEICSTPVPQTMHQSLEDLLIESAPGEK